MGSALRTRAGPVTGPRWGRECFGGPNASRSPKAEHRGMSPSGSFPDLDRISQNVRFTLGGGQHSPPRSRRLGGTIRTYLNVQTPVALRAKADIGEDRSYFAMARCRRSICPGVAAASVT